MVKIQKDHDYISKTSSNIYSKRENLAENTKNGSSGSYKQLLQKLKQLQRKLQTTSAKVVTAPAKLYTALAEAETPSVEAEIVLAHSAVAPTMVPEKSHKAYLTIFSQIMNLMPYTFLQANDVIRMASPNCNSYD